MRMALVRLYECARSLPEENVQVANERSTNIFFVSHTKADHLPWFKHPHESQVHSLRIICLSLFHFDVISLSSFMIPRHHVRQRELQVDRAQALSYDANISPSKSQALLSYTHHF